MSYKLEKPYTDAQRADFVVVHNHQNGRKIEETATALYALEAYELLEGDIVVDNTAAYEAEQLELAKEAKYKEANEGARAYLESGEALFAVEPSVVAPVVSLGDGVGSDGTTLTPLSRHLRGGLSQGEGDLPDGATSPPAQGDGAIYHIEATDGNIGKLTAYALGFITGQLGAEDVVYWNTKEDETIALTQTKLSEVLMGLGQVQAQVWNAKFPAYLAQIEAAATAEAVRAIEIDYSQPAPVDFQWIGTDSSQDSAEDAAE